MGGRISSQRLKGAEMRELKWCGHLLRRECPSLAEQEVPQLQGRAGTVWASGH